ncbi:unnamed protein product [Rotaria sp. Silwood2]|nr:unnamed protein product [Rotaria sp. Silwood2]CAF4580820.1 unnamed protein product [Rotaria sp. Silwood2]
MSFEQRTTEDENNNGHTCESNQSNIEDNIYIDCLSLKIVDMYIKIVQLLNCIQHSMNSLSYRSISAVCCLVILSMFAFRILDSYSEAKSSLPSIKVKKGMLDEILKYKLDKYFLNDKSFVCSTNDTNDRYDVLFRFIVNEFTHIKIKHDKIDLVINDCSYINIFITALQLILNLSWWTNCITLLMAVINKLLTEEPTANSLKIMIFTHISFAGILLFIHTGNLILLFVALMKKGTLFR